MSPKIVCYDIETSPNLVYSWGLFDQTIGINQIVKESDILCFAATEIGSGKVESFTAWDSYENMLQKLWDMMDSADYLAGYNQIGFDDKHVKAAFVKAGLKPPSPYRSVDLLRVVKKNFRFPSNKLAYVCDVLGLDLKSDPGGFNTWKHILGPESPERVKAQNRMRDYCEQDVRVTAQLFDRLLPWVDGLNVPLSSGGDDFAPACTRCGSGNLHHRGWAYTTSYRYKRMVCVDCGGWMRSAQSDVLPNKELLRNV